MEDSQALCSQIVRDLREAQELLRSNRQTKGFVSLLSEREFQTNLRLSSA